MSAMWLGVYAADDSNTSGSISLSVGESYTFDFNEGEVPTYVTNSGAMEDDDGKLSVVTKDSVKYFGTEKNEWCVSYTAADGSGKEFCRYSAVSLNGDEVTDITDLVYLHNNLDTETCDINGDGETNFGDTDILRMLIIGINDF